MLKENGAPPRRRPLGRHRRAGAGARLQGAARLDHADVRRGGVGDRSDRGEAPRTRSRAGLMENLDRLFARAALAPRSAGRGLIAVYRYTLSPLIGLNCRHLPTCSVYADEAIDRLWSVGWRLDDAGAAIAVSSVRHVRSRFCAAATATSVRIGICRGATPAGAGRIESPE